TFGQMTGAEKEAVSHRGRAFRALAGRLATLGSGLNGGGSSGPGSRGRGRCS
ncbi:MAG: non-canonical purine NTP pyrophosphatase, partial [Acidimicrobiales bacterium]